MLRLHPAALTGAVDGRTLGLAPHVQRIIEEAIAIKSAEGNGFDASKFKEVEKESERYDANSVGDATAARLRVAGL